MHPTPSLTDDLRHALSIAMGHPDDWGVADYSNDNECDLAFGDTANPFVVQNISDLDDDHILVEGYWPSMPVEVKLDFGTVRGIMDVKFGGNVNLDANPAVAALLKKSA